MQLPGHGGLLRTADNCFHAEARRTAGDAENANCNYERNCESECDSNYDCNDDSNDDRNYDSNYDSNCRIAEKRREC